MTDYLSAAEQVGAWLLHTARRDASGWWWPSVPGVDDEIDDALGWGSPGVALFFTELYRTTGEPRWLEPAVEGSRGTVAMGSTGRDLGLFTGIGGWLVLINELADATGDGAWRDRADRLRDEIIDRAQIGKPDEHWDGWTEALFGAAGLGALLLDQRGSDRDRSEQAAIAAGDWLLARTEPTGTVGIRWNMGPADRPSRDIRRFPNFAHGTAGIASFLAHLTEVTGEPRFLDAALAGTEWILSTCRTDDDTCAAYHHLNGGEELFTLGWCHGPPGLGWLFRQLEITTGDASWRTWLRRAARADRVSGIPEQKEPGFWDNVGRCCGSASVAEFFLDLHRLEGLDDDLAFATVMVDDILDHAIVDESGMRWSNIEFTIEQPALPPETTYLQGAAGIGSTLLRMHRHLNDDPWVVRWPHAPTWEASQL